MAAFQTAVDIANRALDNCGASAIDEALGFDEVSTRAEICSRLYDKLRQVELARNTWVFAVKEAALRPVDEDTRLLAPSLWVETTTYFMNSIVADGDGVLWISVEPDNLGNNPQSSSAWAQYSGPMTVSVYDSTVAYYAGELVYVAPGDGTARIYISLVNANSDNPATATAWDATVTYKKNQVVTYSAVAYMSLIDLNLNQTPSASPAAWASGTTYGAAASVAGSDGVIYTSIAGGNIGNDPTTDGGVHWTNTGVLAPWTTTFVGGTGSINWLQIGGAEFPNGVALAPHNIIYPLGTGPASNSANLNIYRLPNGFLRKAPQDPKAGISSNFGAPTNRPNDDWLFTDKYIKTRDVSVLLLRFVADMANVREMPALFCEGLGARMGLEICEPVTQSSDKKKLIASVYEEHMTTARTQNAIITGAEAPPLDDFIACRA